MTMIGGEGFEGIGEGTSPKGTINRMQGNPLLKGAEIGKLDLMWNDFPLASDGPFVILRNTWRALLFGGPLFALHVRRMLLAGKWMIGLPDVMRRNALLAQVEDVWPSATVMGIALNTIYEQLGVGPHVIVALPRVGGKGGMVAMSNWREGGDVRGMVQSAMESVSENETGEGHAGEGGPTEEDVEAFLESIPSELREFFEEPDKLRTDPAMRAKIDKAFADKGMPGGFAAFVKKRDDRMKADGTDPDKNCGCPFCKLRRAYLDGSAGDDIGPTQGAC
jgi:hypothetical protein